MATNPYVNKVEYGGTTLIDITDTTADDADVAEGKVYYKASGLRSVGTASGGGGGSSWKHLAHEELEVSTTSTSFTPVGTIIVGYEAFNAAQFIYVRVRDKAGARNGYYSGGDTFISNLTATADNNPASRFAPTYIRKDDSGTWGMNTALTSSSYGIVPYSIAVTKTSLSISEVKIYIRARYNSTNSRTIDGTYEVDVFALATPIGYPTVFAGIIDGNYTITNIASGGHYASVDKTEAGAGETVTVTAGAAASYSDYNIFASIGDGGAYVAIAESPSEGQTFTFTMPESSVYIIAVLNQ